MELRLRRYLRHNGGNFWEERHNADWFKAGIAEMESAIEEKRAALTTYKRDPSEKTLTALRKARGDTQRIARRCANDYWLDLCQDIQLSADCDNTRKMYKGMKKAFGPTIKKTAALRSATGEIITDRSMQMERWVEHYQELYSGALLNVVSNAAIGRIETRDGGARQPTRRGGTQQGHRLLNLRKSSRDLKSSRLERQPFFFATYMSSFASAGMKE